MSERPPSLRQIATATGLSLATVSMALHGHRRIPPRTRQRILLEAERLGYQQDPEVSRLMARVRKPCPTDYRETLAYISFHPRSTWSTWNDWSPVLHRAAEERAHRLGYGMDFFDLCANRLTADRLTSLLLTRGIRGVCLAPTPPEWSTLALDWSRFACVAIGHTQRTPHLHRVGRSLFHPILDLFSMLRERGYERVGLCLSQHENERTLQVCESAYLLHAHRTSSPRAITPLIGNRRTPRQTAHWLESHRPDVVLGDYEAYQLLVDQGFRIPRDIGFVCTIRRRDDKVCTGIYPHYELLGATAIDLLDGCLQADELGSPPHPRLVLVSGLWSEGQTLRPSIAGRPLT